MEVDEKEQFYKLIKCLISIQFLLESLDEVKGTKLYREQLVKWTKKLERELTKALGKDFSFIYNRDEKSFSIILKAYETIAETITKDYTLEEVVDLSEKLLFMKTDLNITKSEYDLLVTSYDTAKELNQESFIFQGREIVTGYAKYLIEYLKPKFQK